MRADLACHTTVSAQVAAPLLGTRRRRGCVEGGLAFVALTLMGLLVACSDPSSVFAERSSSPSVAAPPASEPNPPEDAPPPRRPPSPAASAPGLSFVLPKEATLVRHEARPTTSYWNVERYKLEGAWLDVKTHRRSEGCRADEEPLDPEKVRVSSSEKRALGKLTAIFTTAETRSAAEARAGGPFRDTASYRVCTGAGDVTFSLLAAQRPKLNPSELRKLDALARSVELMPPIPAEPPSGFRLIEPTSDDFRVFVPISAGPIKDDQGGVNFGVKSPSGVAFLAKCEDLPADPATAAEFFSSYRRGIVGEADVKSERTVSRAGNIGSEIEAEMREPRVSVRARVLHDTGRACMFLVLIPPGVGAAGDAAAFLSSAVVR